MAIRVLPETLPKDPDHLARYRRAAKAVACRLHDHITTMFSLEEDGDTYLILIG